MVNWDDTAAWQSLDVINMLAALGRVPEQYESVWQLAEKAELPEIEAVSNIVVTGLGRSAIAGDLLRVFGSSRVSVPITVNRDYLVPEFVSKDTLVFAVSCSGNNEATLSAYDEARSKGASLIAVTSGGKLKEKALSDGVPVFTVPDDLALRAAAGYFFLPMLCILQRLGFLGELSGEIADLVCHLKIIREKLKPEVPQGENQAKQLAGQLHHRIPVIWGSGGTTEVVARCWKGQINENSKAPAYWNLFPELNYDELLGFQVPKDLLQQLYVIMLRDPYDHPRVQQQMELTQKVIKESAAGLTEVKATGSTTLARTYSLIYTGDYTGVYLATLYGMDPGLVK